MKAVMNTDNGIRVIDADEPEGAGVRLSVASAGICGTDVSLVSRCRACSHMLFSSTPRSLNRATSWSAVWTPRRPYWRTPS